MRVLLVSLAFTAAAWSATAAAQQGVTAGELVVEPPTLISLARFRQQPHDSAHRDHRRKASHSFGGSCARRFRMPKRPASIFAERVRGATQVVFITEYEAHAVAAFEQGAADYLLKPLRRGLRRRSSV